MKNKGLQSKNQLHQDYFGKFHFSTQSSNITHILMRLAQEFVPHGGKI